MLFPVHKDSYNAQKTVFLYSGKNDAEKGLVDVIIAKQRNGPIGEVQLAWLEEYTRFANATQRPVH